MQLPHALFLPKLLIFKFFFTLPIILVGLKISKSHLLKQMDHKITVFHYTCMFLQNHVLKE